MPDRILVLYGSYRSDRMGIRLANFVAVADAELMISHGGLKRRRLSVPASYRHTDETPKSALGH